MIALFEPKEGLSFEEFDHYWLHEHGKLFASLAIVKEKLLKYEQVSFLFFLLRIVNMIADLNVRHGY